MRKDSYGRFLAQRLSSLTKETGRPLKDIAADIDISVGALSNYQNGKAEPGLTSLCAIADYFDVPVDWLVGRSQVKDPKASEASVCEYLRLSQEAVRSLRELSEGSETGFGRVVATELTNWIFSQDEFQMLLLSIWMSFYLVNAADTSDAGLKFAKVVVHDLEDPKYSAMSALIHLLDDKKKDYLKAKELD